MSYEPTLIISRDDLRKSENLLENFKLSPPGKNVSDRQKQRDDAYVYLLKLAEEQGVLFKGMWIILCRPELTSFNRAVRDVLSYYDIEYAVYD
jgi:hypothetical protein